LMSKHQIRVTGIAGPGFNGIRISPNVYTSLAEVDRFSDAVEASLKSIS
jgi:isopenicillin-N epimerase